MTVVARKWSIRTWHLEVPLRVAKSPSGGSTTATRYRAWLFSDIADRPDNEISLLYHDGTITRSNSGSAERATATPGAATAPQES
ncbi:hypothetical protein [Burkholderia ubonensis]|uniref:hypothetical protein n=1 Tax=Burkholderia ubonensis TaxID=101571 RepID=UPI0012FBBDE2|nr:hypothetical protein [Burkholderia ubonensis]